MATLTDYKGLEVVDPDPSGAGGLAIQNDLKKLVDWQAAVLTRGENDPPGLPNAGDRYIVGTSPIGAWSSHPDDLTEWDGTQWLFLDPQVGFPVYVAGENILYYWDGTSWLPVASGTGALSQVFDAYDAIGGQTFTSGTVTLNLDTARKNSDANIFLLTNDELTISDTAAYVFIFRVSTDINTGSARSSSKCWLEADTGSGFSEVTGSRGYMYNRLAGPGENTATVQAVLNVSSGDKFRIRINREAGTDTVQTIANASGLTVFKFGTPGLVGTAGDPAGADTQVQFNNAGVFGADSGFTYDNATTALQVDNLKLDGNTLSATDTNGNLILSPNGNGAIQVDTGGNARGKLALDLQDTRNVVTQVASGPSSSIVGGRYCTASGSYSTAKGALSTASSVFSSVSGFSSTASGIYSTANGLFAAASGSYSVASGFFSVASGSHSVASGASSTASGSYSSGSGRYAHADKYGQYAHAAGTFVPPNSTAQVSRFVTRCSTTDATATDMFLDGSSARLTIPTDTAWDVTIRIVASQQGMANLMRFDRSCLIVNDGGTTSISGVDTLGTDQSIGSPGAWSVALTADNTNDALKVAVTGAASTNIRWVASVDAVEVSYP